MAFPSPPSFLSRASDGCRIFDPTLCMEGEFQRAETPLLFFSFLLGVFFRPHPTERIDQIVASPWPYPFSPLFPFARPGSDPERGKPGDGGGLSQGDFLAGAWRKRFTPAPWCFDFAFLFPPPPP